uniref:Uncharacterized protein n=1 Tax=Cannabis sativa TaxID=3483 RepID=A0A803NJ68_CANSA
MANFWWKTSSSKGRGITWMSWERMSQPKEAKGLGFRLLYDSNLTMLAKQGWSIWNAQSFVREGVHCVVGTREDISVLSHQWLLRDKDPFVSSSSSLCDSFEKRSEDQKCKSAMLCWAIWKAWNALVWNKTSSSFSDLMLNATNTLSQWLKAQPRDNLLSLGVCLLDNGAEIWKKSYQNNVKVNVGVVTFEREGMVGFGYMARNEEGYFIVDCSSCFN